MVGALAKKLQSKLSIGAPEEGLELLYRPDEQVARIVEETRMGRSLVTLPATLSDGVRREYEEAIQSFLPDHPFLRRRSFSSTVFSDYVLSWCQAPAGQLMIEPGPTPPKVGAFFAMFMSANDDQPSVIAESTVPQLLASWSEQCAVKGVAGHSVLIGSPEGQLDVLLLEIEGKGAEPNSGFRFTVPAFSGALALSGALKNLSIFGDFGVILGDSGQELIAGPDVFIGVTDIEILAESITVNSTKGRRGAILVASNGVSADQLTEVRGQSGSLSISCPVVPPHLYEHRYAGGLEGWPFPDLEWFIDLKAVLLSFGQSVAGRPAVFEEKMEKAIVGARPRRAAILSDLMDKRVVAKDGRLYRLDLSRLSELGFGLRDVVSGEPSPEVTAYLVSLARA
ncbi:MAG: hypothetical protein IPM00_12550 [Tetrasphaera sp.]|nr:hypothetical protein [Tetrasphaera sp.]